VVLSDIRAGNVGCVECDAGSFAGIEGDALFLNCPGSSSLRSTGIRIACTLWFSLVVKRGCYDVGDLTQCRMFKIDHTLLFISLKTLPGCLRTTCRFHMCTSTFW
jgi:hypothetical protein